jgi:hypothetical protein
VKVSGLSLEEVMQHKQELHDALMEYARASFKNCNISEARAYEVSADIVKNTPLFIKEKSNAD